MPAVADVAAEVVLCGMVKVPAVSFGAVLLAELLSPQAETRRLNASVMVDAM